jgi:alkyldihydroxyacetonephosphate synthase
MILLSGTNREKSPAEAEETLRNIWKTIHKITSMTGAMAAHHHGVGIARMPIIVKELGTGMTILQLIKNAIDPSNVLCPGKLGISTCKK